MLGVEGVEEEVVKVECVPERPEDEVVAEVVLYEEEGKENVLLEVGGVIEGVLGGGETD